MRISRAKKGNNQDPVILQSATGIRKIKDLFRDTWYLMMSLRRFVRGANLRGSFNTNVYKNFDAGCTQSTDG